MGTNKNAINIFEYTDYKLYLRDYYQLQKKNNRNFSYRYFSMKTGVSPSMLMDIISGRRKLTIPIMKKYADALNLNENERIYFEYMVRFINCRRVKDKNYFFNEMIRQRGKSVIQFMGRDQYEFFSKWYHSVIREIVTLVTFKEDYEWIAKSIYPKLTPAQVKKSIEFLCEIGLLRRDKSGKLIQTDKAISSDYEVASVALKNFHLRMIEIAGQSIETIPGELREISSLTLGVSSACFEIIKERIRQFEEEILTLVIEDTSDSDTVCQLNFQLFPFMSPKITCKYRSKKKRLSLSKESNNEDNGK